jgi:IS6 family transposase
MKRTRRPRPPVTMVSGFIGFRFAPEVILVAVRWYLRYGLSYRDLEELLAERGIEVDHVTLYRWVQRFTPMLIDLVVDAARPCRHLAEDRWFVDETSVKVSEVWSYVYRAVDQRGQVIEVYVSQRRDIASARTFFTAALAVHGHPAEVITDRAPALANVVEDLVPAAWQTRPVREQPGRMRPWPAEGTAQADAWVEDRANGERGDPGARVRPEPASWP